LLEQILMEYCGENDIPFLNTAVAHDTSVRSSDGLLVSLDARLFHWPCGLDTPKCFFALSALGSLLGLLKVLVYKTATRSSDTEQEINKTISEPRITQTKTHGFGS
jgi:hypothetical protein